MKQSNSKVARANLGVIEKVDGAVKYVIPNENYINSDLHKQLSTKHRSDKNTTDTIHTFNNHGITTDKPSINVGSPR
jgi:hypothetical protein